MTAQISDKCLYRERSFSLAGVRGAGLFDPERHGIRPSWFSSACWRGFNCVYAIADGALILTQVNLGLGKEDSASADRGEGPRLFDRLPQRLVETVRLVHPRTGVVTTSLKSTGFIVAELSEPIPFTGGLLLGCDFRWEMYDHMYNHPALTFGEVHELIFDGGRLVEEHDRSEPMAELRQRIGSHRDEPPIQATRREVKAWVKRHFILDY